MRERLVVPVLLIALLAACGTPVDPASGPDANSAQDLEGTWELTTGRGPDGEIEISERWRITLLIEDGTYGGTSACNHYGFEAEIDGSSISIGGVGGTEMGCEPAVMETEARYHSALTAAEQIVRDGDTLTITGADTELVYSFVPPPETKQLTDVRWELESLIYGRGPDSAVSDADPAHLFFASDGTFEGHSGCRGLYGDWIEAGDRITFTNFGARGSCTDESLTEQNDAMINLGDGFTFEIEGNALTVWGERAEIGLGFLAEP